MLSQGHIAPHRLELGSKRGFLCRAGYFFDPLLNGLDRIALGKGKRSAIRLAEGIRGATVGSIIQARAGSDRCQAYRNRIEGSPALG